MRGRANLFGHSIHPMVIVFPLGLLGVVPIFDVIHFITGNSRYAIVSFWLTAFGLGGGLLAAVPGLIDWLSIPRSTRARRVGLTHALVNVTALALYAISFGVRIAVGYEQIGWLPFVLALAGMAFALVGGWFGGELVERLSISVWGDAHPDAPSSLDAERLMRRPRSGAGREVRSDVRSDLTNTAPRGMPSPLLERTETTSPIPPTGPRAPEPA